MYPFELCLCSKRTNTLFLYVFFVKLVTLEPKVLFVSLSHIEKYMYTCAPSGHTYACLFHTCSREDHAQQQTFRSRCHALLSGIVVRKRRHRFGGSKFSELWEGERPEGWLLIVHVLFHIFWGWTLVERSPKSVVRQSPFCLPYSWLETPDVSISSHESISSSIPWKEVKKCMACEA